MFISDSGNELSLKLSVCVWVQLPGTELRSTSRFVDSVETYK